MGKYRHKDTKSALLAAFVTPDFIQRFDRAIEAMPGIETRSVAVRMIAEQWVGDVEAGRVAPPMQRAQA